LVMPRISRMVLVIEFFLVGPSLIVAPGPLYGKGLRVAAEPRFDHKREAYWMSSALR
jgi:hypothetical protein